MNNAPYVIKEQAWGNRTEQACLFRTPTRLILSICGIIIVFLKKMLLYSTLYEKNSIIK